MKYFLALAFLLAAPCGFATQLPAAADQFTTVTIVSAETLNSHKTGEPVPGKFVLTLSEAVPNGDGVLIFIRDGKTVRFPLSAMLIENAAPGVPNQRSVPYSVRQGLGTRQLASDAELGSLTGKDLVNVEALFFSYSYAPL